MANIPWPRAGRWQTGAKSRCSGVKTPVSRSVGTPSGLDMSPWWHPQKVDCRDFGGFGPRRPPPSQAAPSSARTVPSATRGELLRPRRASHTQGRRARVPVRHDRDHRPRLRDRHCNSDIHFARYRLIKFQLFQRKPKIIKPFHCITRQIQEDPVTGISQYIPLHARPTPPHTHGPQQAMPQTAHPSRVRSAAGVSAKEHACPGRAPDASLPVLPDRSGLSWVI
eukprot:gene21973-biopygen10211